VIFPPLSVLIRGGVASLSSFISFSLMPMVKTGLCSKTQIDDSLVVIH